MLNSKLPGFGWGLNFGIQGIGFYLPDRVIQAGLPDKVIQAGLPDKVIQAGLPDKVIQAGLPDRVIQAGLIFVICSLFRQPADVKK